MSLMVLLLAVIFAMKEAGKPERWMWMGFDKVDQAPEEGDLLIDASNGIGKGESQGPMDWSIAKSVGVPAVDSPQTSDEGAIGLSVSDIGNPTGGELDREFWQAAYKRLSDEKQIQLFGLLRKVIRSDFAASEEPAPLKKIIERLAKRQSDFQTLALGEIALMSDAQKKKQRTETLFEFDQRWQQEVMPTLNAAIAGEDYTFAGQIEIRKVVQVLRPLFLGSVEDLGGMGTRGDLPGWLTVWDDAMAGPPAGAPPASAEEVSFLQLSGQPEFYRGKRVSIKGQARTCRKKLLKQTQLPIDHYYEVWVEPIDTDGDGLFCVYTSEIPDAFPTQLVGKKAGKFHEVSVPVELTGTFFKVRSYRDSGEGVSHSPVVIARKIDSAISAQDPEKEAPPGVMFSAIWFAGIAAVATGLAVVIFRSSNKRSRSPGRSTTQRTHRSLEMLEQDSSIKSPAQRVAELAEDETSDSDEGVAGETDQ